MPPAKAKGYLALLDHNEESYILECTDNTAGTTFDEVKFITTLFNNERMTWYLPITWYDQI